MPTSTVDEIDSYHIANLKSKIKRGKKRLFSKLTRKTDYEFLLSRHSKQVDLLLRSLWKRQLAATNSTLIAVGGYGRGSLFPFSDIDLLILTPDTVSKSDEKLIVSFVSTLWDIGLDVGHSVRKINECIDEAKKDITTQTTLMESRFLCGSK